MVRAPCCEKMGLKKGPWTPEEDQVLVSYIQKHGHGNWRALPKQAGLLRCGKSCRLRWTNYLRPDIKRGNFSKEEEETIIKLHEMLGNRWSAIASRLPGRTDNEIKNVWHTHLKKKLNDYQPSQGAKRRSTTTTVIDMEKSDPKSPVKSDHDDDDDDDHSFDNKSSSLSLNSEMDPISPPHSSSSSEVSTVTNLAVESNMVIKQEEIDSMEYAPQIDESFWSDEISAEHENTVKDQDQDEFHHAMMTNSDELLFQFPLSTGAADNYNNSHDELNPYASKLDDGMDFWYDLFIRAEDLPELPEF